MAGMLNQPMQIARPAQPQATQQVIPTFPVQSVPFDMGQGYGAARFLTGDVMIPLNFNAPAQAFTPYQFTPGDFQNFIAAQSGTTSKQTAIPVFNPATGTYSTSTIKK